MTDRNDVLMVVASTFATDPRVRREARTLANNGFRVQVLCWDRQGRRPSRETIDRCLIRNMRLGKTTALPTSRLYYLIAAVLFQVISFLWATKRAARAGSLILHAHDFNTLLGCAAAKQLLKDRVRLVYDCHELTPGIYREWYGAFISGMVGRLEFGALSRVDAIVTANEAILTHLQRHSAAPAIVVYNCPAICEVPEVKKPVAKNMLGLRGFIVLFVGPLRQDYDYEMILDAAREFKRKQLSGFRFVFIGPPETRGPIINAATNEGLGSLFDFRGWVPQEDLLLYYMASDLCFAVSRDLGPNTLVLTPIKLFESMACGVPVAVREGTLAARIVRAWRSGTVVNPARTVFAAELLRLRKDRRILRRLGAGGRRAFRREYNWDLMQARLIQLYSSLRCAPRQDL